CECSRAWLSSHRVRVAEFLKKGEPACGTRFPLRLAPPVRWTARPGRPAILASCRFVGGERESQGDRVGPGLTWRRPASLGGRQRRGGQFRSGGVVVMACPLIPAFGLRLVF